MTHISAVKFTNGYEKKKKSFLLIPKSQTGWKNSKKLDQAPSTDFIP